MAENTCCLLREVQQYDFAVKELNLYLDTHPADCKALEAMKCACEKLAAAKAAYNKSVCPLSPCAAAEGDKWTWGTAPWPWEG